MNDTNNNLNGTVLGNVDSNSTLNNNQMPNENVETLDSGINSTVMTGSQVMDSSVMANPTPVQQPQVQPTQSTFFTNPPVNDMTTVDNNIQNNPLPSNPEPMIMEPAPQVEPTPAYTNPQSINPNPMPGFENPGTIGTTPPISFEPEKQPKKKTNKTLFVVLIIIVLCAVGFGTYYILNYTDLLNQKTQITIEPKNIEHNIGEALSTNIADYANITGTDSRNCSLDIKDVDVTKEGTYLYKVTCGETIKNGNITVVDNTELVIETKTVYKAKGETLDAKEFISTEDATLTYQFVNPETIDGLINGGVATHTVKIKATAPSGKSVEVDGTLVIIEYPIKGYLTCSSNEQNVTGSNAKMTVANRFAIVNDGSNGYGKIASEIHTFKYTDETEYSTLLATYKNDNKVTINNITGKTTFDDASLTITITNDLDNNNLIAQYGEANLKSYGTIMNYFRTTLGYKCSYDIKK